MFFFPLGHVACFNYVFICHTLLILASRPLYSIIFRNPLQKYFCHRVQLIGNLSNSVFERRTSTGSGLFAALGCSLVETLRQIVFIGEKKLSNTNLVVSRHIKREKTSLPADVRRSKTSLLKLPIINQDAFLILIVRHDILRGSSLQKCLHLYELAYHMVMSPFYSTVIRVCSHHNSTVCCQVYEISSNYKFLTENFDLLKRCSRPHA